PVGLPVIDEFATSHLNSGTPQDATTDYPQSGRTFQVLCVRKGQMGGRRRTTSNRSRGACSQEWSGELLGLRSAEAGLRSVASAAVRVRTLVGDCRVLPVSHAACGLPRLRCDGGASTLGRREKPPDDQLSLVPGPVGQTFVLGRGRLHLPHHLEERVRVGKTRGFLG